jgi:hypothetical protein
MDPDAYPDPVIFFIDLQDPRQKHFSKMKSPKKSQKTFKMPAKNIFQR